MLEFINEEDFTLVDSYEEVDGNILWKYTNNGEFHSGLIYPNLIRVRLIDNGEEPPISEEINVWDVLHAKEAAGLVQIARPNNEDILNEYKIQIKEQINSQRDLLHHSGIEYNGNMFQTDPQSILDIMGACITNEDTVWLTMDNTQVNLTVAELNALGNAIAQRKKVLVYLARQYKDAIDSKTSKEEIDTFIQSITWSV